MKQPTPELLAELKAYVLNRNDLAIIYNEDCLKTMSRMEDNSVDVIITSPPITKPGMRALFAKNTKEMRCE